MPAYNALRMVTPDDSIVLWLCTECGASVRGAEKNHHEDWHDRNDFHNHESDSVLDMSKALNSLTMSAVSIGLPSETKKEIYETIKVVTAAIQRRVAG